MEDEFTRRYAKMVKDPTGKIIVAIIPSRDKEGIGFDNFTVHPKFESIGEFLLNQTLNDIPPTDDMYVYVNRDCQGAVSACVKYNFQPFEFWTDLILEK